MSWISSNNATYKQNSKNDLSFYHGFSKTPVEPTSSGTAATTLANASTKGGHTVIGTEVWAEEIPWFGLVASRAAAVTRLSGLTKLNDLVKVDGEGGKVYKYIGADDAVFTEAQWSSFWQEVTLTNGMELKNRHGDSVLRYYLNQPMQTLTTTNNASIDSKGFATRLFVDESNHTGQTSGGSVVSQFAAGTDNIKNGIPSVELNPKLYLGTTEKIAGTHYYDYNVSGTILWSTAVTSSSPKISCFRYIGKTVTGQLSTVETSLSKHTADISDIKLALGLEDTNPDGTQSVTARVETVEDVVRVLLGLGSDATIAATESIATTAANAVSTSLAGTTEGTIGKAIADAKTYAEGQASAAKSGAETTAANALSAARTEITAEIAAAKEQAIEGSTVTLTADTTEGKTGIEITPNGEPSNAFTVGIDQSIIATVASVTAISNIITDNKEEIDGKISTINGILDGLTKGDNSVSAKIQAVTDRLASNGDIGKAIASKVASVSLGTVPTGVSLGTDTKNPVLSIVTATSTETAGNGTDTAKLVTGEVAKGLAQHYASLAAASAIRTVKVNGTALAATDNAVDVTAIVDVTTGLQNGITLTKNDNKVGLSVTPASYEAESGTWSEASYFTTAGDISTVISSLSERLGNMADVRIAEQNTVKGLQFNTFSSGYKYLSVSPATYTPSSETGLIGTWSDTTENYLVTGATVAAAIGDVNAKVDALHQTPQFSVVVVDDVTDLTKWQDSVTGGIKENVIYLVENIDAADGSYIEYIAYKNGETIVTERIGTTKTDLSGYVKTVTINGQSYTATANNAGTINIGKAASSMATGQATTLANQGSVYGHIAENGTLTLGVASATDSVMGVSKMFTSDLWNDLTVTGATDTAVSVKSAQDMYSALASLANGKVSDVVADSYLSLAGFSVAEYNSNEKTIVAQVVMSPDGVLNSVVNMCNPKTIEGGILTSDGGTKRVIATDKIVNGTNMFASTHVETWVDDLSNMTDGTAMFKNSDITVFVGDLSSLETADEMFYGCTLDAESLEILADTLPTVTSGTIDIGASTNATADVIATIKGKGWTLKSNGTAL